MGARHELDPLTMLTHAGSLCVHVGHGLHAEPVVPVVRHKRVVGSTAPAACNSIVVSALHHPSPLPYASQHGTKRSRRPFARHATLSVQPVGCVSFGARGLIFGGTC